MSRPLHCAPHTTREQNNHQACSSRTPPRDIDLQWCLVEDTACPHSSSYPPSKSFSCVADQRFSQPHHCLPQWLASIFLTSSLRPATAREQQNVGGRLGNHSIAPHSEQRIDDRAKCVRLRRSSASFTMFSMSLSTVTSSYIQERLLRISPISTSCNFAEAALTPRTVAINFTLFVSPA